MRKKLKDVSCTVLEFVQEKLPLADRVLLVVNGAPTKRYVQCVQRPNVHRNRSPGTANEEFLYGHIWMTLSLAVRHLESGPLVLPLETLLYLRKPSLNSIPAERGGKFHTTLKQAAELIERAADVVKAVRKRVSVLFDGEYANRSLFRRLLEQGVTLFSRLQKTSYPRSFPPPVSKVRRVTDVRGSMARSPLTSPSMPHRGAWLAEDSIYIVEQRGDLKLQELPSNASIVWRRDSRGAG